MKVVSLFDGISCGQVALARLGIPVEKYYAHEIDKYAIQVTQDNFPETIQNGDVYGVDWEAFKTLGIDLVIGGSPCTYWSISKKNRETTSDGVGFDLFMQYVRAIKELKPKYFIYENNYSIHKDIKAEITKQLGVEPIMIDSALVSAQRRRRMYWVGILVDGKYETAKIEQPQDKGILLKDILETANNDKAIIIAQRGRYNSEGKTEQKLEPNFSQKSNTLTTVQKDNMVAEPIRLGHIGKGGQAQRIYSVQGKSINLTANGGGQGAKTGLYKIDLPNGEYAIRKLTPVEAERLQTLPDNYTKAVSNTQRYKGIGNGWTVDVICHILQNIL